MSVWTRAAARYRVSSTAATMAGGLCLLAMLIGRVAIAHVWLTQQTLDEVMESIEQRHSAVSSSTCDADRAANLFRLGEAASDLAALLNEEVQRHGMEQQDLIAAAARQASAFDINVGWSSDHERFFYDGAAYFDYLDIAPDGPHAAASRYNLITLDFYLAPANSVEQLESRAESKRNFLESFPNFPEAGRVGIFLGIDYRDLYRLCRDAKSDCARAYADRAIGQFRWLAEEYEGTDTGELGKRLLGRTEDEIRDGSR